MYNKLEKFYKMNSPYNIIKKPLLILYVVLFLIMYLLYLNKLYIVMFFCLIIAYCILKKICKKFLNVDIFFRFKKKSKDEKPLSEIISYQEKYLLKKYLKKEKLYDDKILECFINHYRSINVPKINSGNISTIISIIISIVIPFFDSNGFNVDNFVKAIPYIITIIIYITLIYFSIKSFFSFKIFIKGEDGMYERLEIICTELYVDYLNEKSKDILSNKNRKRITKRK